MKAITQIVRTVGFVTICCAGLLVARAGAELPRLQVSRNGRFLVTEDGKPFFWLGDTAWRMVNKASRSNTSSQPSLLRYFDSRAAKGFNVIQTVVVGFGGQVNAAGHTAFIDGDWARSRVVPGPANDYWDDMDWIVDQAAKRRLYLALLPFWLNTLPDNSPLVTKPAVAYRYGHFLGERYGRRSSVIWVLGGDAGRPGKNVDHPARLAMIRALAEGIADGVSGEDKFDGKADWGTSLMTYHPPGRGRSSSLWVHTEPWHDFNMIQTTTMFAFANYETVRADYNKTPTKPTLDAEVAYEDSLSLNKDEPQNRRISPWDVRRAAYWNVFAGGFGHTYGHRSNIQWVREGERTSFGGHIPWAKALDAPGAGQMAHLKRLMESLPFLSRVPDQSVIAGEAGKGFDHARATRDSNGTYALVYLPTGKPMNIRLGALRGEKLKACWFGPRNGTTQRIGEFAARRTRRFTPPTSGHGQDWVLVLSDKSWNLPAP